MSLPTAATVSTLAFVSEGQPLATYQPSTANTLTMSFVFMGQPVYAQGAGSGGSGGASARPVVMVIT